MPESGNKDHKNFSREILQRFSTKNASKKKKPPVFIFFIAILILFTFIFRSNSPVQDPFSHSSVIRAGEITYRLTITQDVSSKNQFAVLSVSNESDRPSKIANNKFLARITVKYLELPVQTVTIVNDGETLDLKPGATKVFNKNLESEIFHAFSEQHPEYIVPFRRTIFSREKRHIPLTVVFSLGTVPEIATELHYKYYIR